MKTTNSPQKGSSITQQLIAALLIIAIAGFLPSCKKTQTGGTTPVNIRMTDAPAGFSAVNVDLQGVAVTGSDGHEIMLNTTAGIYNLLAFSGGVDTLIAVGSLQGSSIQQVRLILGPNNSVVSDGTKYPLSMSTAQQAGLKVQLNQPLQAGTPYNLILDFDATQSIAILSGNSYQLIPVIRVVEGLTGAIQGTITPVGTIASVTATLNGVSLSSMTDSNGGFLISNLPAGVYSVTVTPPKPLPSVTVNNIRVSAGLTTNAGAINL